MVYVMKNRNSPGPFEEGAAVRIGFAHDDGSHAISSGCDTESSKAGVKVDVGEVIQRPTPYAATVIYAR